MRKIKLVFVVPAIALMAACTKDSVEDLDLIDSTAEVEIAQSEDITEMANPNGNGNISEIYYAGSRMMVEEINGEFVYQGDIMLPPDMLSYDPVKVVYEKNEKAPQNKSVGRTSGRWPNNTVYYSIEANLDNKARVYDAIQHWESKTNLKFVERSSQSNYVYFVSGSGCSSYVGMIGGRQNITLSSSCSTGNTIHEIGHAIGLWHEQSRVDRENHITINYQNIQSGREHNFKTYEENGSDGDEFTTYLDFGSIMMYGSYSFSANGQPTIVKKDGSTYSIQRSGLSSGDVNGINSMYPATSTGTETTTEPNYVDGEYYTVHGLYVLRYYGKWYYYTRYGWRTVIYVDGTWRYAY